MKYKNGQTQTGGNSRAKVDSQVWKQHKEDD